MIEWRIKNRKLSFKLKKTTTTTNLLQILIRHIQKKRRIYVFFFLFFFFIVCPLLLNLNGIIQTSNIDNININISAIVFVFHLGEEKHNALINESSKLTRSKKNKRVGTSFYVKGKISNIYLISCKISK